MVNIGLYKFTTTGQQYLPDGRQKLKPECKNDNFTEIHRNFYRFAPLDDPVKRHPLVRQYERFARLPRVHRQVRRQDQVVDAECSADATDARLSGDQRKLAGRRARKRRDGHESLTANPAEKDRSGWSFPWARRRSARWVPRRGPPPSAPSRSSPAFGATMWSRSWQPLQVQVPGWRPSSGRRLLFSFCPIFCISKLSVNFLHFRDCCFSESMVNHAGRWASPIRARANCAGRQRNKGWSK